MGLGKATLSYRKLESQTGKSPVLGGKKLFFAHKFSSSGETEIDLTNLTVPTDMSSLGFQNPSAASLASANLLYLRENLMLISSSKGLLMDWVSYDVVGNTKIRLKNGAESQINEIIIGVVSNVNFEAVAIDAKAIVQTGTIAVGQTDVIVGEPFTYNKYSSTQMGDVMFIVDGIVQMRNADNVSSGKGNYYEVAPSAGNLSNTLRLNAPVTGTAKNFIVVSNGLVAERPTAAILAKIETLAASLDQIIQDLSLALGNPTSRYQVQPNSVDLTMFGDYVKGLILGGVYDAVVGSAAQVTAGLAHFTSIQSAINAVADGSKILVLQGNYTENLSINKKLSLYGKGHGSSIIGTLSVTSGANYSIVEDLNFSGNIAIGANKCFVRGWTSAGTVTDTGTDNVVTIITG